MKPLFIHQKPKRVSDSLGSDRTQTEFKKSGMSLSFGIENFVTDLNVKFMPQQIKSVLFILKFLFLWSHTHTHLIKMRVVFLLLVCVKNWTDQIELFLEIFV